MVVSMGRPRVYEEPRVATAIRLPASLRAELRTAAVARDVSVNLLVTRAVSEYLRRLPPVPDDVLEADRQDLRRSARAAS
jgi:hypothetical protein